MSNALNEFKWQYPVGLPQQRHINETNRVAQQRRIENLYMTECAHDAMHKKVGHQLAHMIYDAGNAVESGRAAQIL